MIAYAIDAILVLVLIEGVVLALIYRRTGAGLPLRRLVPNLAAGFFLMLGIRLALAQEGDAIIAACLLGALVAHLADLAVRWTAGR